MTAVYVLLSEVDGFIYKGLSRDPEKRLKEEHNLGRVRSTRGHRPYRLVHVKWFATMADARGYEKYLKTAAGRRKTKEMLDSQRALGRAGRPIVGSRCLQTQYYLLEAAIVT